MPHAPIFEKANNERRNERQKRSSSFLSSQRRRRRIRPFRVKRRKHAITYPPASQRMLCAHITGWPNTIGAKLLISCISGVKIWTITFTFQKIIWFQILVWWKIAWKSPVDRQIRMSQAEIASMGLNWSPFPSLPTAFHPSKETGAKIPFGH